MTLTGEDALRALRAEWRTRQVLDAAARLLPRSGVQGLSMQELAEEAGVSVGLLYRYFGSKEDLLLAVIIDVLDAFREQVPPAVDSAGDDPVRRLAAGFRAYCEVLDARHYAALLTFQESRSLSAKALDHLKDRELETVEPLRRAIDDGVAGGVFVDVAPDLAAYDLVVLAHAWVLKHWYFTRRYDLDTYVAHQTAVMLRSLLAPRYRMRYWDLLKPDDLLEPDGRDNHRG